MKLWPRAIPRPLRFHDLRHGVATMMLRAGVDAHRVQRVLRHSDIRTTLGTYGHLEVEDLRSAVNAIAPNGAPAIARASTDSHRDPEKFGATLVQRARRSKKKAGLRSENLRESGLWMRAGKGI